LLLVCESLLLTLLPLRLLTVLKEYYLGPRNMFDSVVAFNEKSNNFDFNAVLRAAGVAA
jgi:hypothetical protein